MTGITNLSALIESARRHEELLDISRPADPHLEIAAVARATDGGPVTLFRNVKGHPGRAIVSNVFGSRNRIARLCGVEPAYLPRYLGDAALNPVASREVTDAACHDTVITTGIDIYKTIPVTQQTEADAGYVITGGLALARDPETGAFNGSYHRMRVLGKDRTCITIQAGRHLLEIARKYRKAGRNQIPLTVNVGAGPAVLLACSGSTQQTLTPFGYDELGFAGAIQQEPVGIVRARTQDDAWALAEAELVLEGYIDTTQLTSEEDSGQDGVKGMMPEAGGYMGRAWKVWEFQVTAITHRRDYVYWFPLASPSRTGFDLKAWYGVMGPANMPKPVVDKLNAEITKALRSPDLRDSLESRGMEIIALDVPQSTAYVKTEMERWAQAVKVSGAKAQ